MTTRNWPDPNRPGVPIPLKGGGYCLVDEDKIEKISPYNWGKLKRAGNEYARAKVKVAGEWKVILMHRLLTDAPKGLVVDQKNVFLGRFDSLEDAILHRSKVEIEMFGEFAPKEIRNLGAAP